MIENDLFYIKKILRDDRAAMQSLYDRHERHWFRLCLRYGKNRSEAQDVFQEGLIGVFKNLKQFDSKRGAFQNWSNRIMVNAALKYLEKQQRQSFEDLSLAEAESDLSENILGKISAKELTQIIQQLPPGYRIVFNMYEIEGFSHKEIAAALNISIGTSKSQLAKAKKSLRKKLEVLFT